MFHISEKDLENLKDIYNLAKEESNDEIISDCLIKIEDIKKEIKITMVRGHTELGCY